MSNDEASNALDDAFEALSSSTIDQLADLVIHTLQAASHLLSVRLGKRDSTLSSKRTSSSRFLLDNAETWAEVEELLKTLMARVVDLHRSSILCVNDVESDAVRASIRGLLDLNR